MPQANRLTSKPHDFKGLADWVEVFRAGTHTDSSGQRLTFTAGDLDQMVANFAPKSAPAVLGHPKHNDPAYAWASGFKREGDSLFTRFEDIHPGFEAGVKSGAYHNRSIRVVHDKDKGWRVRHIGWLGAVPPAIEGLKPVEFAAADEADVHDFADTCSAVSQLVWAADNAARLFRGFREYLIEKDGIEAADRVVPAYQIDSIASSADQARAALLAAEPDADDLPSFSSPTNQPGGAMPATQEELQRARDEAAAEATKKTEAQFAAQGKELTELRAERKRERIATVINGFKAKGLVLPAEEAGMAAFMAELDGVANEFSFSAADGVDVKKTPAVWFAEFVASRQPLVNLRQKKAGDDTDAQDETSDDPTLISQKAMNYIAEQSKVGITVELSDAVAKFTKKA